MDIRDYDEQAFLERVRPELAQLENTRQKKFRLYKWRRKIGGIAGALLTPLTGFIDYMLLFVWSAGSDDSAAGLTVLLWAGLYWWITQPKRQYARAYKKEILPDIARLFGDFSYSEKGRIDMGAMEPSKIVPDHDRYKSEDYFEGRYKGTEIEFSEIKLEERRRSGKRTRYVNVFRGLAILIVLPENKFLGHTILMKDQNSVLEFIKSRTSGLKRADLVDPEFEKQYDVYTNDQVEARYLFDPAMIERVKGLAETFDSKAISAACYDGKMLFLVPTKTNYFEPAKIEVKATDPETVRSMKAEIGMIMNLIDHLELYDTSKIKTA